MNKNETLLIDNIKLQAKYFLEEAGEFYPFGACINSQNQLKPIGLFLENEFPTSQEVLSELIKAIKKFLIDGSYTIAAVGIDVNISSNENKISALRIIIYNKVDQEKTYDFSYTLSVEKKVEFES